MKRGGYLQRHTPLERKTPMRRSRMKRNPARRIAKRAALRPYLGLVAKMPCAAECGVYRWNGGQTADPSGYRESMCSGPIQVAHLGPRPGVGMKCPDDEVGPLCMGHHADFDQHRGIFAGWSRDERRAWADEVIRQCRLAAIPTTREEAIDLEALGLGRIIGDGTPKGWSWMPGAWTEVSGEALTTVGERLLGGVA